MGIVVGLDIGGTKLAGGVLSGEISGGQIDLLERREQPSRAKEGAEASLAQVYELTAELVEAGAEHGPISGIGICSPGPLNPETGVVFNPTNMPGWFNVPLAADVSRRFQVPCRIENDANGAGLAEALFGAGRGFSRVFYTTISTGIGTGIIIDGRVYHGKNGVAGEGGHVSIDYRSAVKCNCGSVGCIESLASGTAIARRARDAAGLNGASKLLELAGSLENITAQTVAQAARQGDSAAVRLLEETGEMLAAWLANILSLLDPDIVVIGGGVSKIGEPLFQSIRRAVPSRTVNPFAAETPIVAAQLQNDVGIFGAAAVILSR